MAPRLKDQNGQIPNGMSFVIPALKWQSPPWASIHQITVGAIAALQGNPHVAQKLGWSLDYDSMRERVDLFNAAKCKAMGWNDYIADDGSVGTAGPFHLNQQQSPLEKLQGAAAGGKEIVMLLANPSEAVPKEQATKRSEICVKCPLNENGDLIGFFTRPVVEAILKGYNLFRSWKLTTTNDHLLHTCNACNCPLKLKVHFPIDRIVGALSDEQKHDLHTDCWIRSEVKL